VTRGSSPRYRSVDIIRMKAGRGVLRPKLPMGRKSFLRPLWHKCYSRGFREMVALPQFEWGIIMRRELLAGVSTIALAIASVSAATLFSKPADAADLARKAPPPMAAPAPVYSWTGCYVGAHVGWGWGHANHTESSFSASFHGSASGGLNQSGALFGGQVGCNYQFWSNWVIGVQGDLAGTDINGKGSDPFDPTDAFDAIGLKTEWLASVTGRLGYAFWNNQVLGYVKGGGAWARDRWDVSQSGFLGEFVFNSPTFSETRSGWTVGVGAEWTLWSPNWTAFVEYNFYRFDDGGLQSKGCGEGFTCTFATNKQEINTVKVGVNYKFNWFAGGY
jgi:outer membrane immunogenic protein